MLYFLISLKLCLLHFLAQDCMWRSHDFQADIFGSMVLLLPSQEDPSSSCSDLWWSPCLMCSPFSSYIICCSWVQIRLSTGVKTCSLLVHTVVAEATQRQTAITGHYNPFQLLLLTGSVAHRIGLSGCIVYVETNSNLLSILRFFWLFREAQLLDHGIID